VEDNVPMVFFLAEKAQQCSISQQWKRKSLITPRSTNTEFSWSELVDLFQKAPWLSGTGNIYSVGEKGTATYREIIRHSPSNIRANHQCRKAQRQRK
jgi:hypothetical protein